MCVGAVGAFVYSGLQLASGIAQARSIRAEGEATNSYYQYLAQQNQQQAILAERTGAAQSKAIQDTQKLQGRQLKISQAEFNASQQAALAANGIVGVTASDIAKSTFSKQALDENILRYNSDVKSYESVVAGQNQAYGLRSQATGFQAAGAQAKYASQIQSRNTLLSSAIGAISPFAFGGASLFKSTPLTFFKSNPSGFGSFTQPYSMPRIRY